MTRGAGDDGRRDLPGHCEMLMSSMGEKRTLAYAIQMPVCIYIMK